MPFVTRGRKVSPDLPKIIYDVTHTSAPPPPEKFSISATERMDYTKVMNHIAGASCCVLPKGLSDWWGNT